MKLEKKTIHNEIITSVSIIQKEILLWETRISEKEKISSELSLQIEDIKIALNIFLGEYNARVGLFYVDLDKIKLKIMEYQHRIELAKGKNVSCDDLKNIEKKVEEEFLQERSKIDNLENEASELSGEYKIHLEKEKNLPSEPEFKQELKRLYRILALKFHPDMAKNDKERIKLNKIMSMINEAYENGDLETLKNFMKQAEREEKIANETPEEKLLRLKEEYKILSALIIKLREELKSIKANDTYKLKEKVDGAKKEGKDLLENLAINIKKEISANQKKLDELVIEYKQIIEKLAYEYA